MKRTAALVILFLLALSAAAQSPDPVTFHIAFTGDSGRLVVVSHVGGIKVLSVPELKEIRTIALTSGRPLRRAAVSPNGRWLAADDDGDLLIWNLETGEAQTSVPMHHHRLIHPVYVFGPDDTLFVSDDILRIWDVKQGREVGVVKEIAPDLMTVSPDGRFLVVLGGCEAGRVGGTLCVYAIDKKNIVAAGNWKEHFRDLARPYAGWYPRDLVYTKDDRILLTVDEAEQGGFHSCFFKPADLTLLEETVVEPERGWLYPGLRSTASPQLEAASPDGKWKATAFHKRLFLYRVTSETTRTLEKFTAIP